MKKAIFSLIFAASIGVAAAQTSYTVSADSADLVYSNDSLEVEVGDTVFFEASGHPTYSITQSDWQQNTVPSQPNGIINLPSGVGSYRATSPTTVYYACADHASTGMKGRIFVVPADSGMSVGEMNLVEIKAYPNPVTDFLQLELQADGRQFEAQIVDAAGRLVRQVELTNNGDSSHRVPVSDLKAGAYILKVSQGNTSQEISFVKR